MLLTIFKYLWTLPLAIIYIVWTVFAVKKLIKYFVDQKNGENVSFWSDDYAAVSSWIVIHMFLMFATSFGYFVSGGIL